MVTKNKTKRVVLNVRDNKYPFLIELLNNFDFIQVEEQGDSEEEIVANLTEAFEQIKLIKEGKLKTTPAKDFLNEL
ncbi:MAG: hypothetical protein LBT27_02885 [Prevotellaceae bacterium]|jgi:hypothetical protein|nr:hypothetical protein [Prevotellaceae bacterium]